MVEFFEAYKNGTKVHSVKESLLQIVRLLEELDETQRKLICNMIDTVIANKRIKEALNNAMKIAI